MTNLLHYTHFYLVGVKGVAMTAMAQLLIDAKKTVTGCDVSEEFVTQETLNSLKIHTDTGFDHEIPESINCVIYTSAHSGKSNPIVQQAVKKNIPCFSHAEALALLTQNKKTIAVCGVGGKSTVSAMIAWIFENLSIPISYSVGVGTIPKLNRAAKYAAKSEFFVVEADEYVTDTSAKKNNEPITPRFSYFHPNITVATNIVFDHPDVYEDFDDTKEHFEAFFNQIQSNGTLVLSQQAATLNLSSSAQKQIIFGKNTESNISYIFDPKKQKPGVTVATIVEKLSTNSPTQHALELLVPGEYNIKNALAAVTACFVAGIPIQDSINALKAFSSTQRRFELKKQQRSITFYDDYAHHPKEIVSAIKALNSWYPDTKKIIAFQPHTYSRTKQLLHEFVHSFKDAETVLLLDIFASAREAEDASISSDMLTKKIKELYPNLDIENVHTIHKLKEKLATLDQNRATVVLTLGAGDIYKVHDMI